MPIQTKASIHRIPAAKTGNQEFLKIFACCFALAPTMPPYCASCYHWLHTSYTYRLHNSCNNQVLPSYYTLPSYTLVVTNAMAPQLSTDSRGVGSVRVSKARFHELLSTSITSILPTLCCQVFPSIPMSWSFRCFIFVFP